MKNSIGIEMICIKLFIFSYDATFKSVEKKFLSDLKNKKKKITHVLVLFKSA